MELQHSLGRNQVCKHIWRSMHPIHSSSTATVVNFNWLVFNLPTALRESNTCVQHSLHCGNFFTIRQRDVRIWKRFRSPKPSWAKDCQSIWHQVALPWEMCFNVKKCYGVIVSALDVFIWNSMSRRHLVLARSYRSPLHCLPYISLITFSLRYPSWVRLTKKRI